MVRGFKFGSDSVSSCSNAVQAEVEEAPMEAPHLLTFGPFCLDATHRRLWRGQQPIALRPRSLAVLKYLVEHPGRLLTKAELRQQVWAGTHVTDIVLRVSIREIRAALDDSVATPHYVETVGQEGYRFLMGGESVTPPPLKTGPIVGRQREVAILEQWFQRAASGQPQLGFVSGEVGIGKTMVVNLFLARLAAGSVVRIARGQCVEHYGVGESYQPLLGALERFGHGPDGAPMIGVLRRYAPMWLAQLPGIMNEVELERLQRQVYGATPARMLRELGHALAVLAADTPLVLVLEDLHWSDSSTVDVLAYLGQQLEPARLLVLGTYRPVDAMLRAHPLRRTVQELCGRGQARELSLELLPAEDVAAYVAGRCGGPVAPALAAFVHQRTDGNALFMVNVVEHLVQQDLVVQREGQWTLRQGAGAAVAKVPEGVQQLLVRRIEELAPETRQVLEAASVVGEAFAAPAVAAGVQSAVEDVQAVCDALAAQHHFIEDTGVTVWPDGTRGGSYRFQHTLYQQVLYNELGNARRGQLHRRIGARLQAGYGVHAGEIAAQLAVHFERGGEIQPAVHYWQHVADTAARRNAHHEAIAALRTGLALLATLPEDPKRTQQELTLQLTLGDLVMAAKGMGAQEAGEAYTRAHVLCQQLGATPQRFGVLSGLTMFHATQGRLGLAQTFGQQLLDPALCQPDPVLVCEGHTAVGVVALYRGDLIAARTHFEQSLELSAAQPPSTPIFAGGLYPGIASLVWLLRALWVLGYADQAQQRSQDALALARHIKHAPSIAYVEYFTAMLCQYRREAAATHAHAKALMAFATAQGLMHRLEQGRILLGWALAMEGDAAGGVQQIQQGLAAHQDTGIKMGQPYYLALLAEALGRAAQPEAGLTVLAEALTLVATTEERWWEAELSRLTGALRLQLPIPDVPQAEACFQRALEVARRQQAKALELRAAMSLSRLWQRRGKREEARQVLAEVYGWFTEGFDTPDLQEAKALLEELSSQ
jgi:predicted ATPase